MKVIGWPNFLPKRVNFLSMVGLVCLVILPMLLACGDGAEVSSQPTPTPTPAAVANSISVPTPLSTPPQKLPDVPSPSKTLAPVSTPKSTAEGATTSTPTAHVEPTPTPTLAAVLVPSPMTSMDSVPEDESAARQVFVYVSAGAGHTCGLRANGTVGCWGRQCIR